MAKRPTSTTAQFLLGLASLVPALGVVALVALVFGAPVGFAQQIGGGFGILLAFIVASFGVSLVLGLYFLRIVWSSDAAESDRQFWVTFLLRFFPVAGPVFWYRVIWKGVSVSEATKKA